jgi:hypothetical protein
MDTIEQPDSDYSSSSVEQGAPAAVHRLISEWCPMCRKRVTSCPCDFPGASVGSAATQKPNNPESAS